MRRTAKINSLIGCFLGALASASSTPIAFSQTSSSTLATTPDTQATTLNYDVDLALSYIDRLTRGEAQVTPWLASPVNSPSAPIAAPSKPRALGLRYARFTATWQNPQGTNLRLVLRPDAVNRLQQDGVTSPAREVDTRAGESYRPAPSIRLLDAYQITLRANASLSAGFGVFEQLSPAMAAYNDMLGFGLEVRFPAKFSALRLRWHDHAESAPTSEVKPAPRIRADLYLMQGNEDRAEAQAKKNTTADSAPVAADPYTGGATYISFNSSTNAEFGVLVGFDDNAESGGKRNEVFAAVGGRYAWDIGMGGSSLPNETSVDIRYAEETWRSTTTKIKDRTQLSQVLTNATKIGSRAWLLVGFANGQSDRPVSALEQDQLSTMRGYGVEAGILNRFSSGLDLQLMLSHERRTQKSPSGSQGGFIADDDTRSTVRRIGLEIRYTLNDNV